MYSVKSGKKLNFSFFLFIIVLFAVVSATFGTISSAANSDEKPQSQQVAAATAPAENVPAGDADGFLDALNRLDFFNKVSSYFARRENGAFLGTTANFAVTTLSDAGPGSLRKAVADANAAAGDDTISFDPSLNGTITLTSGEILINSNISISKMGANNLSVSGTNASRVFNIAANSVVSINNLNIINGRIEGSGAGIINAGTLTLTNSTVSDNTAVYTNAASSAVDGGGISNSGTLNIQTSTLKNNTVQVTTLGKASGGALSNSGTASIADSAIITNSALGKSDSLGGGIANVGTLNISNSTLGSNAATTSSPASNGLGGGLYNAPQGLATIRNSTLSFNRVSAVSADGGGIYNATNAMVTMSNSIISDNTDNSGSAAVNCDFSGIVSSDGYNLISDTTGSAGWVFVDKINLPAKLAPLGSYGGPTQTFGLLPNSPAIDAGSNLNPPATDQRGSVRIAGARIDIGSFENNDAGTVSSLPNGTIGSPYSQNLASSQPSTLTFSLAGGSLPSGLTLSPSGTISGTPTTGGGRFTFSVSFTNAAGLVNFKEYTIFISFTITNLNDSGAGSLRQAITDANSTPGDDNLTFQSGLTGTLTVGSELLINSNINIVGTGTLNLAISGNNTTRIFNIAANSVVNLSNITVRQGKTEGSGGAILNAGTLNLASVVITDSTAVYSGTASGTASGGGIANSGTLSVSNSTIKNNGAQIVNLGTASGGGIFNTGTVTFTNSTISNNTATGKPTASGGGIANSGTFNISNSTIGVNTATASSGSPAANGGGIWNGGQGVLTIRNTTVGFNIVNAATASGGGIFSGGGAVTIGNTIVGSNSAVSGGSTVVMDVAGTFNSEGRNLVSNSTGSTGWVSGDKLDQAALLTSLGNYGGATQTFGLLPNSPAINGGNNANAPATDQRGATRIIGGTIDIGSFENDDSGTVSSIPDGAVGSPYNQSLAASLPSTLTFSLIRGSLPSGLSLSPGGTISGTPTSGGRFTFSVSFTNAAGLVNFKEYSIFIPFTITNLNDSGAGSLRQAITDANASSGNYTFTFQSGLSGTLTLGSELLINSNINIVGTGASNLIFSGNNTTRIFNIAANSVVTISGITIKQGRATGSGGAILNAGTLNLASVVITDSTAVYSGTASGTASGGGIANSGTLTLLNTTVNNNTAQIVNLGTASGGGIFNTGTVTFTNSTISNNTATGKPTASGGGIANSGTFNISNSTIGVNTATAGLAASGSPAANGGGIWNGGQGVLTIRNTTVGFNIVNAAAASGGGIFNDSNGSVTIGNTIVSDDSTINGGNTVVMDVAGTVVSEGKNLISNSTGSTGWISGDKLNQPALITPLGDYGGATQTFGLLPNSQAINAGNNANAPATDQRGATRIIGGTIDIGSFENNVTGVLTAIPNVSVGGSYNQNLALSQPSTLTFALVDGALPTGLTISADGTISGTATTGGTYNFTISVKNANGFVGYKQYAIVVTCTYSLSSTSQTISSAGGGGTVDAIANSGCSFTVFTNNASFITITTSSVGNGNTTVGFNVAPNNGPPRTGSITVANLVYTINQAGGCTYLLSSSGSSFVANGGNGSFNVNTSDGCQWTATSNDSWITVNTPTGTGSGPVSFTVQANTGPMRSGTITAGGLTYVVSQGTGCSYTLSQNNTGFDSSGGTGSFTVNTQANCPYTAASNASWLTINSGGSGIGTGAVTFTAASNTGAARTGTISVGGQTFTVSQASGCTYSISLNSASFSETGGSTSVNVTSGSGCTWTAVSNVPWITVTGGSPGTGNGTVNLTVASNPGAPRTGTLTIAGLTFTVTQSGCAYTLSPTSMSFAAAAGSGSFNVAATSGCSWTAVSNASWVTIVSGGATGNGSVTFNIEANIGPARIGTITVAGQTYTINQAGGCSYSLFPVGASFPASAGTSNFSLNVGAGCAWTAVSNVPWLTITSPGSGTGSVQIVFSVLANPGAARVGTLTVGGLTFTVNQAGGGAAVPRAAYDFDGDGKSDISVFRPDGGFWYLLNSQSGFTGAQFGAANDKIVPADYDGDGKTDLAVYRNGTWYIQGSSTGFIGIGFGLATDIPQPADFDGDGKADLAVFRPSNGVWYVYNLANNQFTAFQFGSNGDKPVVGDYDGDGKADYAVFRPSNGTWFVQRSQLGFTGLQFGAAEDKPVPADYDGDGKTDFAVYRPSSGIWYEQRSTAGFTGVQFGISTDLPTPADYDGDGKADIAVYRSGTWFLQRTTAGFTGVSFGAANDKPAPNAYIP